jgi:hypothetical protein
MDVLLEKAVTSRGNEYIEAEAALRQAADGEAMAAASRHPDPLAPQIAKAVLGWKDRPQEYTRALAYIENLPKLLERTPITAPSPAGVAAYLKKHFDARVTDILAVRLLKSEGWPWWRTVGVLMYLKQTAPSEVTPALVRFAAETASDEERRWALEAIVAAKDPNLKAKLDFEAKRAAAEGRPLPPALLALGANR